MSHYARLFAFSIAAILAATVAGSAHGVTIATVPVGDAGNAPDPLTGSLYGAVPYNYGIGTYDVTNAQYAAFLNAKASASDPYGLWGSSMNPGGFEGAISRSGSGPFSYAAKSGDANKPVIYVSWYEAVRFINWLQNGQGNGDTETGSYQITNGGFHSGDVLVPDATQRSLWAATNSLHWLLPSENEWYKAAYYKASDASYYTLPFQSDSFPASLAPPGNANSGNFQRAAYNYDGNGSYLSDVGAYPNSLSPFGSFDMGGEVFQWNEAVLGPDRGLRGGDWAQAPTYARSYNRNDQTANAGFYFVGFRVASVGSVPEPSTGLLAALAFGVTWLGRKRFK